MARRLHPDVGGREIGNITTGPRSIYWWQDKIEDAPEAKVTLHTRASHVSEIVKRTLA